MQAVTHLKIKSIIHKYLITGHTQNEDDNVHSIIEKAVKRHLKSGAIYVPAQYISIIRGAKKTGLPYNVNEMVREDFLDLKALSSSLGVNFSKTTDNEIVKMADIKVVKVEKSSPYTFSFKTSFSQENYQIN